MTPCSVGRPTDFPRRSEDAPKLLDVSEVVLWLRRVLFAGVLVETLVEVFTNSLVGDEIGLNLVNVDSRLLRLSACLSTTRWSSPCQP